MEGPQCELGAGLADGLGRNDPHGIPDFCGTSGSEVDTVAFRAGSCL